MLVACACMISQVKQSDAKVMIGEAQRCQEQVKILHCKGDSLIQRHTSMAQMITQEGSLCSEQVCTIVWRLTLYVTCADEITSCLSLQSEDMG